MNGGATAWRIDLALEAIVARYGLAAVFLGAGIEGEAVVITAGILAHQGLLSPWGVAVAASLGACLVDQLWFWMARRFRHARWVEKAQRKPAFKRALAHLENHLILFTLGFRFIYGMRTVAPIAISASHIRTRSFVVLNLVSAMVWGPIMTALGYGFGEVLAPWLHGPRSILVMIGMAAAFAAVAAFGLWVARRAQAE